MDVSGGGEEKGRRTGNESLEIGTKQLRRDVPYCCYGCMIMHACQFACSRYTVVLIALYTHDVSRVLRLDLRPGHEGRTSESAYTT